MTFSEIRAASGLTQAAFAEATQIPLRTVQNWDVCTRTPPAYVLTLLDYYVKHQILSQITQ